MRVLGLDPGASTGAVLVELPDNWQLLSGKVVRTKTITPPTSVKSGAEKDRGFHERCVELVTLWRPSIVVMEDPSDGAAYWGGNGPKKRGTDYRLGVYKGLLFSALLPLNIPIIEYRVKGDSAKRRQSRGAQADIGWMAEHGKASSDKILRDLRLVLDQMGVPPHIVWSEHCLMAFGVLYHHCRRMHLAQQKLAS